MTALDKIQQALKNPPQPDGGVDSAVSKIQKTLLNQPEPQSNETTLDIEKGNILQHSSSMSPNQAIFTDAVKTGEIEPQNTFGFDKYTDDPASIAIDTVDALSQLPMQIAAGVGNIFNTTISGTLQQVGQENIETVESGGANRVIKRFEALQSVKDFQEGNKPFREMISDLGQGISASISLSNFQNSLVKEGVVKKEDAIAFNENLIVSGMDIKNSYDDFLAANDLLPNEDNPISKVFGDVGQSIGSGATFIGLALVTKNPLYAGIASGLVQQNSVYQEAVEKGFDTADAKTVADISGMTSAAIETVGSKVMLGIFQTGKVFKGLFAKSTDNIIKKIGLGTVSKVAAEEAVIEGAQFLAEATDLAEAGVREPLSEQELIKGALYNAALGALSGGTVSSGIAAVQSYAQKNNMSEDVVNAVVEEFRAMQPTLTNEFSDVMNQQASVMRNNPPDRNAARVLKDFTEGRPINVEKLLAERKDITAKQKKQILEKFKQTPQRKPVKDRFMLAREKALIDAQVQTNRDLNNAINESFRTATRQAKSDIKAAQETVIKAINDAKLTPAEKGKFLATIKNIQSSKQLETQLPKIQERINTALDTRRKKQLVSKIKAAEKVIKNSNVTDVAAKDQLKIILDSFESRGIFNDVKKLPVSDFENAFLLIDSLKKGAKESLEMRKTLKEARKAERLQELRDGVVRKLSDIPLKTGGIEGRLSALDQMKNIYNEAKNKAQRLGLYKNPMDVIFDLQDGYAEYNGATHRVFKQTVDRSFGKYLDLKEKTTRDVKELVDKLKLKRENFNKIGAYAVLQQEGGKEKLLQLFTEAEIKALPDSMTDAELQVYNLMRQKLDSLQAPLADVMRNAYNKDFTKVKDYFPFMTDFSKMEAADIQDMFGDDVFEIESQKAEFRTKDVKKGFTKERTGGKQKVRIDGFNVFLNHVDNATYLIEMGQDIKELGELALTDEYADIAGDLGQEVVLDWLDLLAKKGRNSDAIKVLDIMRVNTGAAILGLKLSSALIQPTALMDGAAFVGGSYVSRGVSEFATNKQWRKFLIDNLPELRERVGDDPAYLNLGGDDVLADIRQAGYYPLQKLDLMAASSVASGAYIKSIESRGGTFDSNAEPDSQALLDAQIAMRRTQSSSFAKDTAPIISQGKFTGNSSVDKAIFQFQSFLLNRWSLIENEIFRAAKAGKTKEAVNGAFWIILANISEMTIRHWTKAMVGFGVAAVLGKDYEPPENEEEESAFEVAARQVVSNIPFVSTLVSTSEYASIPVPAISLADQVLTSYSYAKRSKSEEKKIRHYTEATILGLGAAAGIPGAFQAKQLTTEAFKE
jgi:hypothetical protein